MLIAALVAAVIVASIQVAHPSAQAKRLAGQSWLDLVRPLVLRSDDTGNQIAGLRSRPAQAGRQSVLATLDQVVSESTSVEQAVAGLDAPAWLAGASSHLLTCMRQREVGAAALRSGMRGALGSTGTQAAVSALVRAGQQMQAADGSYTAFVRGLPRSLARNERMPGSRWITDPGSWTASSLTDFVNAVRGSSSLAVVHDILLVVVSTVPAPLSIAGGVRTLPPTSSVGVQAVVADEGNQAERAVAVRASLQGSSGSQQSVTSSVDLAPGQRAAVSLAPLTVAAGSSYTLKVSAGPVPGETHTGDNQLSLALRIGA